MPLQNALGDIALDTTSQAIVSAVQALLTDAQLRAAPLTVKNSDGAGNALASLTDNPTGTERGLITRNLDPDGYYVTGSVSSAAVLFSVDATHYNSVSLQVTSAGTTCTITYEVTNDGITWGSVAGPTAQNISTTEITTSTTAIFASFPTTFRYFRARVSTYTSGTVSIEANFKKAEAFKQTVFVGGGTSTAIFSNSGALASSATGARLKSRVMSAASTNATSVKATAGRVYSINLFNSAASARFLKMYNKVSAPTVGVDTPTVTYGIAAGGRLDVGDLHGFSFSTGIAYAITTGIADADTGAVSANDVVGEIIYV